MSEFIKDDWVWKDVDLLPGMIAPHGFRGEYYVAFVDGSERLIPLIGAVWDTNGHPIYLVDTEKNYYNYANVIRTRKRVKDG